MTGKIKRIKRDICLIKYRKLPLIEYDEETDSDVNYFPESKYFYWIKLENNSSKKICSETIKLLKLLKIKKLIFLDAVNKPWISKITEKRKDHKPLFKTIEYFKKLKIHTKFNGGIEIEIDKMNEFLPHFYLLIGCDSGFFDYYFADVEQNIIFYLHYSGEIKILSLSTKINNKFLEVVKKTKFVDSNRENTNKI